jgi:predicted site-specific integrase-resolvase
MEKVLMTSQEVREFLSVTKKTLIVWAKRDILHPIFIGGKKYFRSSEINNLIEGGRNNG